MVKYIQIIRWQQPTNDLNVLDRFVGLGLKGLNHALTFTLMLLNKRLAKTFLIYRHEKGVIIKLTLRVLAYHSQGCGFHPQQCQIRDITTGTRHPRVKHSAITVRLFIKSENQRWEFDQN